MNTDTTLPGPPVTLREASKRLKMSQQALRYRIQVAKGARLRAILCGSFFVTCDQWIQEFAAALTAETYPAQETPDGRS